MLKCLTGHFFARRFFSDFPHKRIFNMNTAYFKIIPEEELCQITFRLVDKVYGIDRTFNFNRKLSENVDVGVGRIKTNVEKVFNLTINKLNKKALKKGEGAETIPIPEINIRFLNEELQVTDKTFADLAGEIEQNAKMYLQVSDNKFEINLNSPSVTVVTLPSSILAGFYVYPSKLQLEYADQSISEFVWSRGLMPKSNNENEIKWEAVGKSFTYLVRPEDIGFHLKLNCTPKSATKVGPMGEVVSKCEVQAGPGQCPFEVRHLFTQNKLDGNKFRVASYNILADLYADSDYSRTELFPYCPPYALHIDYRKQLFIKEILGYHADIICLQEVDGKIFDLDFEPLFREKQYEGFLQKKGTTAEGLATFYNSARFELVEKRGINLGPNVDVLDIFKEVWDKIKVNEKLVARVVNRSTAVQTTLLKSLDNPGKYLLVANTHLYFHPDADHVRLLQFGLSMLYVRHFYEETVQKLHLSEKDLSIIFCGDFNSVPECGIYKLMTEKMVPEDFIDWQSNKEEAVQNVTLAHPYNIRSATGCPKYTNFTPSFAECIDYIFYQEDGLAIDEVIPLPSDEELRLHKAIPSVVFPSDHIALVANLKWV